MIFQSTNLIHEYIEFPALTVIQSEKTEFSQFDKLLVCIKDWPLTIADKEDIDLFILLGFNHKIEDFKPAGMFATKEQILNVMSGYLKTKESYLREVSKYYPVIDIAQENATIYEPYFTDVGDGCLMAKFSPTDEHRAYRPYRSQYLKARIQIPEMLNNQDVRVAVAVYTPEDIVFLYKKPYFSTIPIWPRKKMRFHITMNPEKHSGMIRQKINCIKDKGLLLPYEYYSQKCHFFCYLKTLKHGCDCIPLPIWFLGYRETGKLVCNGLSEKSWLNDTFTLNETVNMFEKCMSQYRCEDQRPCTYWKMNAAMTSTSSISTWTDSPRIRDARLHITLHVPATLQWIEQRKAFSFDSVVAEIGGIMGVWCGISAVGLIRTIFSLSEWWKEMAAKRKAKPKLPPTPMRKSSCYW